MNDKQIYIQPQITLIEIDSNITLQLESNPPIGPEEVKVLMSEFSERNPFKEGIV